MKKFLTFFLAVASLSYVFAFDMPDHPDGYVNDYVGVFSKEEKANLEEEIAAYTASTTNELAVVVIPELNGETVEQYANELFMKWGIGKKDKDNGVLFLIAINDRKVRIEVGYGLEGDLPDSKAGSILRTSVTPNFKSGDYAGGIYAGVEQIMSATGGNYIEPNVEVFQDTKDTSTGIAVNIVAGIMFGLVFLTFLFSVFMAIAAWLGRSTSWYTGGVVGAFAGGCFIAALGITFVAILVTFVLAALGCWIDYVVSRAYQKAKKNGEDIPWWAGGGYTYISSSGSSISFGDSSSSSSFSSSDFGGGSSGGGGASSSW
jgi:uncharacterized protein